MSKKTSAFGVIMIQLAKNHDCRVKFMLLHLHRILDCLESVRMPVLLDQLKADLAIDEEILASCASYIILHDGMMTLRNRPEITSHSGAKDRYLDETGICQWSCHL